MPDYLRFGGELPAGCDPRLAVPEPFDGLAFSHGRATLGWLLERRGPFSAALISAYTCPSVVRFCEHHGLAIGLFDVGADAEAIAALIPGLPGGGRILVSVPALLGFDPWLDAVALAEQLGERALVVVDAAQTGFGHRRYRVPPGGAVLSCPRKTTALADGACLMLDGVTAAERESVAALPEAGAAVIAKRAARALFAARDPALEEEALALAALAERDWPAWPCRISAASLEQLIYLDAAAHDAARLANRARLRAALDGFLVSALDGPGVPFGHAVLVDTRSEMLARLRARRVFATPLWPDAVHDPARHPRAADLARRLLLLPIDQRYSLTEIDRLGELVGGLNCSGKRNSLEP
ncbi:MAG: hypothetical protein WCF85_05215 [Rhodospirillaceae bacterium]